MFLNTAQKMKFSMKDFTFTEEILNGKLHFLCSEIRLILEAIFCNDHL